MNFDKTNDIFKLIDINRLKTTLNLINNEILDKGFVIYKKREYKKNIKYTELIHKNFIEKNNI